eukprot:jgi/Chrpa1/12532/Chrysochromulina_OHIO_Genome00021754-RA
MAGLTLLLLAGFEASVSYHRSVPSTAIPSRHRPPIALSPFESVFELLVNLPDPEHLPTLNEVRASMAPTFELVRNAELSLPPLPSLSMPPLDSLSSDLASLSSDLASLPGVAQELLPLLEARQDELMRQLEVVEALLEQAQPPPLAGLVAALSDRDWLGPAAVALGLSSSRVLDWRGSKPVPQTPYPSGRYDPATGAAYAAARPLLVVDTLLKSLVPASGWGLSLLIDWLRGPETLKLNARVRAEQLVTALTAMGPTFIKVGQALSIRADLLPPAYITALTGLQDRVPAFPSAQARATMATEWGLREASQVDALFERLSAEPVAAASLGQVYKGTLRAQGDQPAIEVAVKVQRPDMAERIAVDLVLLRALAGLTKRARNMNSDLVGLVDDWGRGFVDELDYVKEADNTIAFLASLQDTPLKDVVTAPTIVGRLSTSKVIVTQWVDGERLEKSQANDVSKLCGVALNTYLTMLLGTGLLHCDPHPGNLLRTTDGRLCILDWGLVTQVSEGLQFDFLEHVAHLTAADYARVPNDLVALGFVPAGMEAEIQSEGVVDTLTSIYSMWAGGGGVAKIDVNEVSSRLQKLVEEKGNMFQIPPYFAYILRAFSVLEGIALINDPDYSILKECLPYISQRVLTDSSPRATRALRSFVYANTEAADGAASPVPDAPKLAKLAAGFSSFSASSGGLSLDSEAQLKRLAAQVVDLLLSRKGSPLQELLLDEVARLADANARAALMRLPVLPAPLLSALDPTGVLRASSPLLSKYDEDDRVLAAASALATPIVEALPSTSDQWGTLLRDVASTEGEPGSGRGELVRYVAARLWERRADWPVLASRLAARIVLRGIDRVDALAASTTANTDSAPASQAQFAAALVKGGLAAASAVLLAVAPAEVVAESEKRGVVTPTAAGAKISSR